MHATPKRVNIFQMKTLKGKVAELFLDDSARIHCPPELIPFPGQYLLAHADASDSPLPVPLFFSQSAPKGFRCAPPIPSTWKPGEELTLRGPIGHGFALPYSAKKITLVAYDDSPARLRGLISMSLRQNAEVVLVCDSEAEDLPEIVEVQPLRAMLGALQWADYAAMDVGRENLFQMLEMLGKEKQATAEFEAQVLVRAPMPCGALAECGVCALALQHEWKIICRDGPVFELRELV